MFDPAVVGMITGGIGAAIGIGALWLSAKSYRRVTAIKSLDLRIELRRAINDHSLLREGIDEFLDAVNQSHERVMNARGQLSSGAGQIWKKEFADDKNTLTRLLEIAPQAQGDYEKLSPSQLEDQLVAVHLSSGKLKGLREKYKGILQQDDDWRELKEHRMNSRPPITRQ